MKSYRYIARDLAGARRKGLTQAVSSNDVLNWLREQGFTPISINEISGHAAQSWRTIHQKHIKSADLAALCWQLATMLDGGIPITTAFDTIAEDIENSRLQQVLQQLSEKVKKGQSFSESVAEFPKVFNRLSCAIILAGETSGNLAEAMNKLADHFDSRDKLAKKVKGAMAYPIFVFAFIVLIVVFIMAFIIPRFRTIFDQLGGELVLRYTPLQSPLHHRFCSSSDSFYGFCLQNQKRPLFIQQNHPGRPLVWQGNQPGLRCNVLQNDVNFTCCGRFGA
jgi:type II secretory pathway component PulF